MKKSIGSKRAVVGLCAVLVAVSAFFYAPMQVEAFESDGYISNLNLHYTNAFGISYSNTSIGSGFENGVLYLVELNPKLTFTTDRRVYLRDFYFDFTSASDEFYLGSFSDDFHYSNGLLTYSLNRNFKFVLDGALLNRSSGSIRGRVLAGDSAVDTLNYNFTYNPILISAVPLTGEESASYQQGYNSGYSAGEQAGQDIGYSNGYEVGFEQGENQGYESGFEAGKDSVDTDSYYDMGYSAGYDAGYLSGYDKGYDEGYDAGYEQAVSNLTKYGADANTYPIHLGTVNATNTHTTLYPIYNMPTNLEWIPYEFDISSYKIEPNYNYRILGLLDEFRFGGQFFKYSKAEIYLQVGGKDYYIGSWSGGYDDVYSPGFQVYIPGSEMASKIAVKVVAYNAYGEVEKGDYSYPYMNLITSGCTMTVSNMGLASAEVNQIANSTDVLENTLEEQKEIQKEQAETQKGIAQSIKDFFGSFFDNLINSIIHVIVPTKEEMGELFNRLNDFFSETFGFLYYPFEFIISAFNIFLVADSGTGLTLPAFSIMGYEVWGSQTYDIASEPIVGEIFGFVRMGTGAMLVMWFVNFLKDFFDKRFGGGGS